MSELTGLDRVLWETRPAVENAIRSQGWRAARLQGDSFRLAGGSVDHLAYLVTHVRAMPTSVHVETRLPMMLTDSQRRAAVTICSALNANTGVVSIDPDNVPVLFDRIVLFEPERAASAMVVELVLQHRRTARAIYPLFLALVAGSSTENVAARAGIEKYLPRAAGGRTGASLDTSRLPPPDEAELEDLTKLGVYEDAEAQALAKLAAFNGGRPGTPCAGPLVSHVDGVLECFGCTNPLDHLHPGAGTASCRPERRLGLGHACSRCVELPAFSEVPATAFP